MKTIHEHIEAMKADLGKLVTVLNKDGAHEDAERAQQTIVLIDNFLDQGGWPPDASWPIVYKDGAFRLVEFK